jgi:endonuclease/exonuclease/phosphatase family metal-dependent hydrolase
MTALVTLFLAEGQRAFFASVFALSYDALFPVFRVDRVLLAILPFLALAAPLLPLARWSDRAGAVTMAALATALARLAMVSPALPARAAGGALVLAGGAVYLTWAVGRVERRALAAGTVLGLVVDALLRLAGSSYDLSLQPGWLPVQVGLSAGLATVAVLWARAPEPRGVDDGLERRAGGLRLRGALALGGLLFLDLHVVGLTPVAARWSGVSHALAAGALTAAGALGVTGALLLKRPSRGRITALLLVALLAAAPVLALSVDGPAVAIALAGAHLAALLLVTRALDPASGRRSGAMVTAGFAVFALATALYALTFFPSFTLPAMDGAAPWIFGLVGVLLAGSFVLLPRPAELEPLPPSLGVALGVAVAVAGAALVWLPAAPGARATATAPAPTADLRVATWNVHYGFDQDWRFDPGAMAAALAEVRPDVVALQEAVVGAPTAYGIDLPLWLSRRLGLGHHFAGTVNGLLGDAFLSSRPAEVRTVPLPAAGGERKQMLVLSTAPAGGPSIAVHALHLGLDRTARNRQLREALAGMTPGPAAVVGDLNAEDGSDVARRLRQAGFVDALGRAGGATFPAREPQTRIDWIWVRGLDVASAAVLDATASDHRPLLAVLRPRGHGQGQDETGS